MMIALAKNIMTNQVAVVEVIGVYDESRVEVLFEGKKFLVCNRDMEYVKGTKEELVEQFEVIARATSHEGLKNFPAFPRMSWNKKDILKQLNLLTN